ncbi:hypothetical protein BR93DRAFT_23645 [Coniochaeta sp. PMI_546]|nr:hypothetical protein BR93DRAFT_23645 [Coniochaeta sp. PMI_546]
MAVVHPHPIALASPASKARHVFSRDRCVRNFDIPLETTATTPVKEGAVSPYLPHGNIRWNPERYLVSRWHLMLRSSLPKITHWIRKSDVSLKESESVSRSRPLRQVRPSWLAFASSRSLRQLPSVTSTKSPSCSMETIFLSWSKAVKTI